MLSFTSAASAATRCAQRALGSQLATKAAEGRAARGAAATTAAHRSSRALNKRACLLSVAAQQAAKQYLDLPSVADEYCLYLRYSCTYIRILY